jgi:calcium permeable stress-gated cation channel
VSMLDLAQVFSLIWKTVRRKFNPTPRELIEWTAPLTFDFASYYNYALFYVTIALSYATIAPLVAPFALLYFTLSYGVHKYDMMYVYFTRNETNGMMWRVCPLSNALTKILFHRVLFAAGFANVFVFIVVFVNYNWQHAIVILPLLPILIAFKLYCWKFLDPRFDYYIPDKQTHDPEAPPVTVHRDANRDKLRNRFGHPAWAQKLIAPMVHAKANHLLPTVYHGRMNLDNPSYLSRYGQNVGGIGKVEVVAEGDLDYENFRVPPVNELCSLRIARTLIQRV